MSGSRSTLSNRGCVGNAPALQTGQHFSQYIAGGDVAVMWVCSGRRLHTLHGALTLADRKQPDFIPPPNRMRGFRIS